MCTDDIANSTIVTGNQEVEYNMQNLCVGALLTKNIICI